MLDLEVSSVNDLVEGEELDRLISNRVFKWDNADVINVPQYSTRILYAMNLFDYLRTHKYPSMLSSSVVNIFHDGVNWHVNLYGAKASAKNLCLAICRMAMLLVDYL